MKHDIGAVICFQNFIVQYCQQYFPERKNLEYYSDGCTSEYKNCTNFLHLCKYKKLYDVNVQWVFFATSHGKSPCDALGGTLKREAAKESLARPYNNQILTVNDLHAFCQLRIPSIQSVVFTKEDINIQRQKLSMAENANTIPGTRGYHHFVPISDTIMGCKTISLDDNYDKKFDLLKKISYDWTNNIYVSFIIKDSWHIGFINNINELEFDAEITVLDHVKKNNYKWPDLNTKVFIPLDKILCEVTAKAVNRNIVIKLNHTISKFNQYLLNNNCNL